MGLIKKNKTYLLLLIALITATKSNADIGLIADGDGFVNVRESPSLDAKVIAKLNNRTAVSCVLEGKNAKFCLVTSANLKQSGYVYKDRVDFFKAYTAVPLFKSSALNAIYKDNTINISIEAQAADTNIRNYSKTSSHNYTKYKGKAFYGTDGELPEQNFIQLSQININIGASKLTLNSADVGHLFLPREDQGRNELSSFKVLHKGKDLYLFNTLNEGGAAAYHLFIYIHDGKWVDQKVWREEI